LWQQQRDLFNWAMTTAESDRDRAFQIMYHNLEREDFLQDLSREQRAALSNKLARLAMGIIDDINFGDVFGGGSDDNDDGGYTYDPYNLGPHDDEDEDTIPGG